MKVGVLIDENGLVFRAYGVEGDGAIVEITQEWEIHPMAITIGNKQSIGFHIGHVKKEPEPCPFPK